MLLYLPVPPVPPAVSSQLTIKTQTTEVRMNAEKEGLSGWLQNGISLHSLQLYWGFVRSLLQVTIKSLWKLLLKMNFQAGLKHLKHSDYTKSPICSTRLELLQLLMQVLMLLLLCLLVNKTRWLMLESLCWVFNPLCFLSLQGLASQGKTDAEYKMTLWQQAKCVKRLKVQQHLKYEKTPLLLDQRVLTCTLHRDLL